MKKIFTLLFISVIIIVNAQTNLTEAVDFTVKSTDGEQLHLFEFLDDEKIVVIDFFSTSCGPCGDYAPDIQASYEDFGSNEGNVIFMGISWGDYNSGVDYFDSIHGVTYPSVSGFEGGGNAVVNEYNILSYPTVVVIQPDRHIFNQYI